MIRLISLILLQIMLGCTSPKKEAHSGLDIFDKVLTVMKTSDLKDLKTYFGEPQEISPSKENSKDFDKYSFEQTKEHSGLSFFVNKKNSRIYSAALFYWVDFDAYAFLKKRFKDYKWIEAELPIRTNLDYAEELHKVEIPELGISFEYDNQDPLRRPMWIFFKGKE